MTRVKCIRNDSKTLPFHVGAIYSIGYNHGGGIYEIYAGDGTAIQSPLIGHYLEFVIVK